MVAYSNRTQVTARDPAQVATELVLVANRAEHDPWLLPEDGTVDQCAVETAACGCRPVRLTGCERVLAAIRILRGRGTVTDVCLRLCLPDDTEAAWRKAFPAIIFIVWPLIQCLPSVPTTG